MRPTIRLGRIAGIEVGVHWSLLVIGVLLVGSLAGGQLPSIAPHAHGSYLAAAVLAVVLFFASILAHELAHAVVARRVDVPVSSIVLFVFGGLATLEREPKRPRDEILIAAAGPLASAAMGLLALGAARVVPPAFAEPLLWLGRANIGIAIFNCLPGFPLDGGRIARAILWKLRHDVVSATIATARLGQLLAYMFVAFGALATLGGRVADGLWIAFLGWFLLRAAEASADDARVRAALAGAVAGSAMNVDFPAVPAEMSLARYVEDVTFTTGRRTHLVTSAGHPLGVITLERLAAIPRARWETLTLGEAAFPLEALPSVSAHAPLIDVLTAFGDAPLVAVRDGDRLEGVIEHERLLALVRAHLDISALEHKTGARARLREAT
jgi:Zn-dependent protease